MLTIKGLNTHYGASHVLQGVDLDVPDGRICSVLGRNGVGKTTTLRTVMGLVPPSGGRVMLDGADITGWPPHRVARAGVAYVPEGRLIFPDLTVIENIRVAERRPRGRGRCRDCWSCFRRCASARRNRGGNLSGGEQQMLAIARALVSDPKVLLLDEPSQGLAPLVVRELAEVIRRLAEPGCDDSADRAEHEAGRGGGGRDSHHGERAHGLCRVARTVPRRGSGNPQPLSDGLITGRQAMDLNLRGRTALMTGASKGIGRGSAEALAEEGVNVILVSRTQADLDAVRESIASRWNVRAEVHAFDISDSANVDRLVAQHPDIDILVNNAGAIPGGNLQEVDEARWREAWDLKVFGYINMCRRFYAEMKQRGRGVIINILGMAGEQMDAGYIAGPTGNAGLMAFTKTLGGAASADKLRVVGINPGAIATDRLVTIMKKRAQDRLGDENRWEELMKPLPFGRAGTPEEIGWMVAFLASDKSAYTSGTIITIDGGAANRGPMF